MDRQPAPPRIEWRAARDGIGHAHRPGSARTLCGVYVITEALAWPERLRCVECCRHVETLL